MKPKSGVAPSKSQQGTSTCRVTQGAGKSTIPARKNTNLRNVNKD